MRTALLCALGLCLTAACLTERPDSADDFRSFYRGARLAGTPDGAYSHPMLFPDTNARGVFLPFIRPPFYALLLKPLTLLPYPKARGVWISLIVLAFAGLVALFPGPRGKLAIALCFSLPVTYAIMLGQDIAFIVLIALAAGRLMGSQREFAAGLVASLLAIKPTYLLPAGIVFLARSKRGTLGLAAGGAVQLAVSFALEGPRWPFEYLTLLRNPMFDMEPRRMLNLRAIATSLSLPEAFFAAGAVALLIWLWRIARRMNAADALMLALPIGMLASPHSYIYDAVVLIPLFAGVASLETAAGMTVLCALTPLPYLALMSEKVPLLFAGSLDVVATTLFAVARASGMEWPGTRFTNRVTNRLTDIVPRALQIPKESPDGSGSRVR